MPPIAPSTTPPVPTPIPMPPLPDPDFSRFGHGISLLGGWLPVTAEILAVVALVIAIGWRTRRWRFVWVPVAVAVGVAVALGARVPWLRQLRSILITLRVS